MGSLILLQDLIDQRKRKRDELLHYETKLKELSIRLDFLRREIALTEKIISMVKNEQIIEIKKK